MAGNSENIIIGAATISIDNSDLGYTKGGTEVRYEPEYIEVFADQVMGVVKKQRKNERLYVKTTLLEVSLARIQEAFNLPDSSLSGSTLTLGYSDSCSGVVEHEIILVGKSPGCQTRTFTLGRCVSFGNRTYKMTQDEEVSFEIEFECLKDANGNFGTIVDS